MITEADTCRKYVLPLLYGAGWSNDQINEQKTFTDGKNMLRSSVLNSHTQQMVMA
jgi:type I restriction enzyme R subunit